jgi:hypothetical protein
MTIAYGAGQSYLLFEVLAIDNAHIGLSEGEDIYTSNNYKIVIGGWDNVRSAIRSVNIVA